MDTQSFYKVYNASAGSGKTFTLVKEYLKIVLAGEVKEYQKILALTFTNKAAAEMKERVLNTLKAATLQQENAIVEVLLQEMKVSKKTLQQKANLVLQDILHNYAKFNIITIDSFTHRLVRTFSLDLGLPLDFEVEMEVAPLLEEAVDLLIAKVGQDKALTDILVKYTLQQVDQDKSWNINGALYEAAKLLTQEENQTEVAKLIGKEIPDFLALEKRLHQYLEEVELEFRKIGELALMYIDEREIDHDSFAYTGGAIPVYFKKFLATWKDKEEKISVTNVQKCFDSGNLYTKAKPKTAKEATDRVLIDEIKEELYKLFETSKKACEVHFGQYFLAKKIVKSLVPLTVLSRIHKEYTTIKEENNIRVNAEFNSLISKQIKDQPVPFIYERLGEKYQYFFIDEMQDTSELQWENLQPLIENSLSQNKGGLLLVGDAKQAIYRWRGGKASQFIELSNPTNREFYVAKETLRLGTNYRSYSNVIEFNNEFFSTIAPFLKQSVYQELYAQEKEQQTNTKAGGYVRLEVHEREDDFDAEVYYPEKIYQQIRELETTVCKKDICILTRNKKAGYAIADYLVSKGIEVTSPDSLLLKNNPLIAFFIRLLRWFENPLNRQELIEVLSFLYGHLSIKKAENEFYQQALLCTTPNELFAYVGVNFDVSFFYTQSLYDGIEYLVRAFVLPSKMDVFGYAFLDFVLQFQVKEHGNLQKFLTYWDQKKEHLAIEVNGTNNAVQVMTIHKSKGLEFLVVMFAFDLDTEYLQKEKLWYQTGSKYPYQGFESFLIGVSSKLKLYGEQGESYYQKTLEEVQLDNFNLLYVALTRAKQQLYVFLDTKKGTVTNPKNFSDYFLLFMKSKEVANVYEKGTPTAIASKSEAEGMVLKEFISVDKKENQIYVVEQTTVEDTARIYGNIIHKAFEKIYSHQDLQKAVAFIQQQSISKEEKQKAVQILNQVVEHPKLETYYQQGLEVYNENSFLTANGQEVVMDRVVFNQSQAVVIDYKTGAPNKTHKMQINNYANVLMQLGYQVIKKLLVYCNDSIEVEII